MDSGCPFHCPSGSSYNLSIYCVDGLNPTELMIVELRVYPTATIECCRNCNSLSPFIALS